MEKKPGPPRALVAFQWLSAVLVVLIVAGTFAAVWGLGDRFFRWGATFAGLVWLVGGLAALTLVWSICQAWIDAVIESNKGGGKP